MDARYPLWFLIGGKTPDAGIYFQPGYYSEGLEFTSVTGQKDVLHWQFELGATLGFRQPAPKIWFVRATRLPAYSPESPG